VVSSVIAITRCNKTNIDRHTTMRAALAVITTASVIVSLMANDLRADDWPLVETALEMQ
jgi:hypothetical protein